MPEPFVVLTPIYNDFPSFNRLCQDLGAVAEELGVLLNIQAVDDGSVDADFWPADPPRGIGRIELLRLVCNLGHQRAIAVGLADLTKQGHFEAVIVMDCDGEDQVADIRRLIAAHEDQPSHIMVARRAKRSEGLRFRLFYSLYKSLFTFCTGRSIDFGNYMLLPRTAALRLVHMPELWNHLAAAALRSRIPLSKVSCERGKRYAGQSSMSLVTLLAHGLSAVSAFSDLVFVRLLVLSSMMSAFALFVAFCALGIRLSTNLAIPGWASTVAGLGAVLLFQALTLSVVTCLTMLSSRSAAVFIPVHHAGEYIAQRITIVRE